MSHKLDIRVYYEDTDAGGVMYHGTHLNYAERARTEFLRHIGYQNSDLRTEFGMIFLVRNIEIDYLKPAYLDDLLTVKTDIKLIKNTSFVMCQGIYDGEEMIAQLYVAVVCVDSETKKPVRIPEPLKVEFEKYLVE